MSQAAVNALQRILKPMKDRMLSMIGRAVITAVADGKPIQELQLKVLADESLDKVQRFQNFGFNSVPPTGTQAIILSLGGSRAGAVVIATENGELRPVGWLPGEAGNYNAEGMIAALRLGGKFEVNNGSEDLVAVLSDFADWCISTAKVITLMGPQPFTPDSIAALTAIKTRLDTFKV